MKSFRAAHAGKASVATAPSKQVSTVHRSKSLTTRFVEIAEQQSITFSLNNIPRVPCNSLLPIFEPVRKMSWTEAENRILEAKLQALAAGHLTANSFYIETFVALNKQCTLSAIRACLSKRFQVVIDLPFANVEDQLLVDAFKEAFCTFRDRDRDN